MPAAPVRAGARLEGTLDGHLDALPDSWRNACANWLGSAAHASLRDFLALRRDAGAVVYPPRPFAALETLEPSQVRVVILGQDPYHGPGQAHGLAFSVPRGTKPPPSLRNILAEVARDTGRTPAGHGDLGAWASRGVLLLNAVLTVEDGRPGSHARRGWEEFTDGVIDAVAARESPTAFLLWGAQAQAKRERILAQGPRHLILCANHPSPLSARRPPRPFLGCGHFTRCSAFLGERGRGEVDWSLEAGPVSA